jgi:hypothetical protein
MGWEQLPPEKDVWPSVCKNCQQLESRINVLESAMQSLLPHVNPESHIGKIIVQALEVK